MNKILIVDDTPFNRKVIRILISGSLSNVELLEAEDGAKAMKMLKENPISLVILDIMMPEKDGLQVLAEMKEDKMLSNVPVIMYTALDDQVNLEKALALGALDYFTKPLSEEDLRITLPLKIRNALEYYEQKMEILKLYSGIKEELEKAQKLQTSLISENESLSGVKVSKKYLPCSGIGGDFYSCKNAGDKCWFIIADVVGHGISAAMVSAMLKVVFDNSIRHRETPEQVLSDINQTMLDIFGDADQRSMTAFVGCIDGDKLYAANAGQPYPVICKRASQETKEINLNGFLLGMMEEASFEHDTYDFDPGDCLVMYTDGVFDQGNSFDFAGWDRVREYCDKNINELLQDQDAFLDRMMEHFVISAAGDRSSFVDDAAVMVIKRKEA